MHEMTVLLFIPAPTGSFQTGSRRLITHFFNAILRVKEGVQNMEMQKNGWGYLCEKSKKERKEILRQYAESYVEPAFEGYPELKGKIYLALRKNGFIAEYNPVYYIIVPENALNRYGHHVLRAITAHEMGHLLQFQNDIGKDSQSLWSEIQATMLSWERGFAKDFLLAYPENCNRSVCDGKEKHCYFSCNLLFDGCCRNCSEDDMNIRAEKLERLAEEYKIDDEINVKEIKERIRNMFIDNKNE